MKSFIKKNIKFIIVIVICITCSVLTTFATDYLFNSNEVKYNNTTSGIQAGDVQGAIDELYACASNYAAYNQRLTSAENTIGNGSLTTTSQNLIGAVNGLNDQIGNKVNTSAIANNLTTTGAGYVLDARQGKTLNDKFANVVYFKTVKIPKATAGTSWSPTSRSIGSTQSIFGVAESKFVSAMIYDSNFSPSANAIIGTYAGNVYVASTQSTTLSSDCYVKVGYIK